MPWHRLCSGYATACGVCEINSILLFYLLCLQYQVSGTCLHSFTHLKWNQWLQPSHSILLELYESGVVLSGGVPTLAGTSVFTKLGYMGMGYLWLNGWGIYHLTGGAFMAYGVGHLYHLIDGAFILLNGWGIYDLMGEAFVTKWVGHLWPKWVGEL